MKKNVQAFLLLIALLISLPSVAQVAREQKIARFVDNYNAKNYKAMKKDLFFLGKIVLGKKTMGDVFGSIHGKFGDMNVLRFEHKENKSYALVSTSADPTENQRFRFSFNKKGKITGFTFEPPRFQYVKDSLQPPFLAASAASRIDSIVKDKHQRAGFSGCVLAIEGGQVIYKNCYGYGNREKHLPLNDSSVFELASCSKQFTAFAILMLAERGQIKLSDSIKKFIPELPYNDITIEHLLGHTSGLRDYIALMEKHWDKKKVATNEDVVALFSREKPKTIFKPGSRFRYSNTGYALLSVIIEKASGQTYADFLAQNIFKPLEMRHSRVYHTRRRGETIPNYAYGYVYSDSIKTYVLPDSSAEYNYVYWLDGITGDGTVNTSLNDLVKFEKALREGKLLPTDLYAKACSSCKLPDGRATRYGYGLSVVDTDGYERLVHHSGGWPGYHTFMLRFLDTERSVVVLSNNEYLNTQLMVDRITRVLAGE